MKKFDEIVEEIMDFIAMKVLPVFIVVLIGLLVIAVPISIYSSIQETKACEEKGGQIVGTGLYEQQHRMIGKIMTVDYVEIEQCSIKEIKQ